MPRKYAKPIKTKSGSTLIRIAKRYKKIQRRRMRISRDPFPIKMTKTLRYVEYSTIATGAAGQAGIVAYRANGPFDPAFAVGGHQPMLWDTYSSMYNHCVVLGARIKATFWSETAGTTYGCIVGSKLDDDAALTLNVSPILEQGSKLTKYRFLRTNPSGNHDVATVTQNFSAKKFFGVKDVADNKQDIGSLVSTTPTDQAFFCLFFQHPDQTTNAGTLKYMVTIDYIIQFSEPRDLAAS